MGPNLMLDNRKHPQHKHHFHQNMDIAVNKKDFSHKLQAVHLARSQQQEQSKHKGGKDEISKVYVTEDLLKDWRKSSFDDNSDWDLTPELVPTMAVHVHYSMLGLGDIVMPGLLLCFVLRFDSARGRLQNPFHFPDDEENNRLNLRQKLRTFGSNITCFHSALFGYIIGTLF